MVGYSEAAKCMQIKKIFDDAYRSTQSCVLVDNIERLLDYGRIGPRYSNMVLQALLVLLQKDPPKGRKLLVLCTSSCRDVLQEMGMVTSFTAVLRVPAINRPENFIAVLQQTKGFSREELQRVANGIQGLRIYIGIKKLLGYIDMARQTDPKVRVDKFLCRLEDEGCLTRE